MKAKILILALMFVLLVPLYIAVDNLQFHEKREIKTSSVTVTISTTSDWARISFNGATIKDHEILNKTEGLKDPVIESTGIIINKLKVNNSTETIRLKLELGIYGKKVELVTTKEYNGEVNVGIDKVGEYKNNKKPLQLPVTIETTSDWTKLELNGATIRNARIFDIKGTVLREPVIGTKSIMLAKLKANDTSYGSTKFLMDLSLDTAVPTITLEKADNGVTKVRVGELTLENNQTATKFFSNIPLTIETTSNQTEINFKGLYVRRAKPIIINDQNLTKAVVGSDFIFLDNSDSGNSYKKTSYLLDFGMTDAPASITITKNGSGYTVVSLATYAFVDVEKSITYAFDPEQLPSTNVREPLFELDPIKKDDYRKKIFPIKIETTSDWTEVTLKGITITSAEIRSATGSIKKPGIGSNNVLVNKLEPYDNSFASVELLLHVDLNEKFIELHKDIITLMITKGDIGTTTVQIGKMERLVNAENTKRDPRNTKSYVIPLNSVQTERNVENQISYNPVTYSLPVFNELQKQGIQLVDTQEMREIYSIDEGTLPGRNKINFNLKKSDAFGLLSGVILFYLILIILGIHILSKEGFFDSVPGVIGENKTTVRTLTEFVTKLFEKTPASSLFMLEALVILLITPFVFLLSQIYAEGTSILAYFLLVFGVLLRLVGQSEKANEIFQWQDFPVIMFLIKIASIVMILSSLVIAGYEFVGLYGAAAFFILSLASIFLILRYIKRHFERGSYATEW